ncbi:MULTISPECIES: hypothetical protein [Acinetobacter]|uniref:hypothetical protein n=1 Tax=Acinetobacter TaxID=469 RepID=UPI000235E8E5|nr:MULTISPECIES: hypothetical protein [Acinetobacter]KXZ69718.1 hypothetical protein AVENLUH8758_02026 [Acinetobacter venetianus]GAB01775.1 hypothetical protein ACT4_022_00400 [Acinetobacter sp. NBRC 100985]
MKNFIIQRGVNPIDKPDLLGLILKTTDLELGNRHTGFIILKQNQELSIAHLCGKNYRFERYEGTYVYTWINELDEAIIVPLMARLKNLSLKKTIDVEYSPIYSGNGVLDDKNGKYIVDPKFPTEGLTCATFVILMLENFGVNLIDKNSWKITEEDTIWFERMLNDCFFLFQDHFLEKLREDKGKYPRFRPEQVVAAACLYEDDPISFDEANEASKEILRQLEHHSC